MLPILLSQRKPKVLSICDALVIKLIKVVENFDLNFDEIIKIRDTFFDRSQETVGDRN